MTHNDLTLVAGRNEPAPEPLRLKHLINGAWVESADEATFTRHSPAHGYIVSRAAKGTAAEVDAAVRAANATLPAWRKMPGRERAAILLRTAEIIDRERGLLARIETLESGKPIAQAEAEIEGAADLWRVAAALARTQTGETHNALGADMLGLVLKEPVGVVSIITPWNFPFLIVSQKLPFALAAGCTAVVKPSELTPSTTALLGELTLEAGLPKGVLNIVFGYGDPVGAAMTTHPGVAMVSFTGSTAVGKMITRAAADGLKKVSLELGGKNPQVIFPDANLDAAIDAAVFGVYFNAGECCNSGSRLIVHESVAEEVTAGVVALSKKVPFGDPLDRATKVGAIVTPEHLQKIDGYVAAAADAGAAVRLGGVALTVPDLPGDFYAPTVVGGVAPEMAIAREEVFGPVLSVLTFSEADEAVRLVNDAPYGLSASVWSKNVDTVLSFAREAEAGTVWANTFMDGYPEMPFGGFKESGQGRELGKYGLEEFLEVKTVQLRIGDTRTPWIE